MDYTQSVPASAFPHQISVIGLGHVGLPTALGLAELGWKVTGADDDREKVAMLSAGKVPFFEPGLQDLLAKHLASGNFRASADVSEAVRASSVLFLCVGTPQRDNGEADLSQVEAVARVIARNLNGYKLVIEKSTVPVITAQWIKKTVQRYASQSQNSGSGNSDIDGNGSGTESFLNFDVASNPEFLQEGKALRDFFAPDRIVCGVETDRAREILQEIYQPLARPMVITDINTAEIIKHAANAFLATKISFINLVANICEKVGADVTQVAKGIGADPRIGASFLQAGIGFGGYCLPKDLRAFIHLGTDHGIDCSLLESVEKINKDRIDHFLCKLRSALWVLGGKKLGVLGLAFKPSTDDIREAPSLQIISRLLQDGAILHLHDPKALSNVKESLKDDRLSFSESPYEVAKKAHALLLLTEWEDYKELDWKRIRESMEVPIIVDGRNLLDPVQIRQAGFEYFSIGR